MWEKFASSVRAHPNLWGWFANFLFCTTVGIAVSSTFESRVAHSLLVSYSIGFSVHICIHSGIKLLVPRVNSHFVIVAMTIVGIVIGLMVGGLIIAGRPLLFLQENSSPLAFALLFGILGVIGFRLLFELWAARGKLEQAERDALLHDKALAEAELRVLQAQMEPHFLFNTLSNVISLIQTNPNRAARLLEQLTLVLRATLSRTRASDATLGDELELVRAYLEIQAQRMDGRLQHSVTASEEVAGLRLPPLLVQPLVENAILHGVEPSVKGGTVLVSAELVANQVEIKIQDDGVGLDGDDSGAAGECIANIRERLRSVYGENASLALTESVGGGVCVLIRIPANGVAE